MARGFRSVFVCLIALALSVSGYASAAMSLCSGMPIPASQSSDQSVAAAGMERDASPALINVAHRCATAARGGHAAKVSAGDCPASAACGMVAAPAPQTPVLVAAAAGGDRALPLSTPGFGFFTDAPDRPPRALA